MEFVRLRPQRISKTGVLLGLPTVLFREDSPVFWVPVLYHTWKTPKCPVYLNFQTKSNNNCYVSIIDAKPCVRVDEMAGGPHSVPIIPIFLGQLQFPIEFQLAFE